MLYRAIGLMSGSSLDGLDIVFTELHEDMGNWQYEIIAAECVPYNLDWVTRLKAATMLSAREYLLLDADYGHFLGKEVNAFIERYNLHYKVGLIASHGHTSFHLPEKKMTAQLGDGAAIAAQTGLPVVSSLRALDVAHGGQGAPIVPIGEKLLFKDYALCLNIGGIANLSCNLPDKYLAFDVCAANRVLNMLAELQGKDYDDEGNIAASGSVNNPALQKLNTLSYYSKPFPKSLANDFGTDEVYPLLQSFGLSVADAMRTYTEHIVQQLKAATERLPLREPGNDLQSASISMLVTGGGAFNKFLINRLSDALAPVGITVVVPNEKLVQYKEALVMALIGVLRWRQEYNVLSSVTGAVRDSIGGAIWNGQDA